MHSDGNNGDKRSGGLELCNRQCESAVFLVARYVRALCMRLQRSFYPSPNVIRETFKHSPIIPLYPIYDQSCRGLR